MQRPSLPALPMQAFYASHKNKTTAVYSPFIIAEIAPKVEQMTSIFWARVTFLQDG